MYPDEMLVLRIVQSDASIQLENVKVKAVSANGSKHLKMGVITKPYGYIDITQKGHTDHWRYNFTQRIIFDGK